MLILRLPRTWVGEEVETGLGEGMGRGCLRGPPGPRLGAVASLRGIETCETVLVRDGFDAGAGFGLEMDDTRLAAGMDVDLNGVLRVARPVFRAGVVLELDATGLETGVAWRDFLTAFSTLRKADPARVANFPVVDLARASLPGTCEPELEPWAGLRATVSMSVFG